ncbi:oxygen-dependent tRNA uridine(34) hydroxylase TrhO [Pararhizobium mangrovi]|uniref:tRNA uridine(34) hydroxylase n=1 Tax=Pararhizobium mangrovi TaxID=2590452 RepID=A0A506UD27_9HYPH|nr:rhodanese-related sulfurtransferase [Pararhizobium mangrovi]TPW30695.1 rhodanese-related sulfurtransferase [Pararhizobium mangrovi]
MSTKVSPTAATATDGGDFLVAAFYHFARLPHFADLRAPVLALARENGVHGTILLAEEGVNGTIAGPDEGVHVVLDFLRDDTALAGLRHKESRAATMPFLRTKVRLKREIVTMGVSGLDPETGAGTYVEAKDWNALISDPDTVVIDTRNAYETALGTFRGALDPGTESFRDFPEWARGSEALNGRKKIAMFCTGGIRCEKASAFLKAEGFEDVFHLQGGILKYLEEVPADESLWDGACFVFDERVSLTHGLKEGGHSLCRACRRPLTPEDRASNAFEPGVSCPHCFGERDEEDRQRYRERQRQVALAATRGKAHLG